MAVANVPGCGLALRGREGGRATLSMCLTVGSGSCHHLVVLLSVGCHDGGEVGLFVHEIIIGTGWGDSRGRVDTALTVLDVASQDVVKHILIIL